MELGDFLPRIAGGRSLVDAHMGVDVDSHAVAVDLEGVPEEVAFNGRGGDELPDLVALGLGRSCETGKQGNGECERIDLHRDSASW